MAIRSIIRQALGLEPESGAMQWIGALTVMVGIPAAFFASAILTRWGQP